MGFLTDIPTGFPGYNGRIPRSRGDPAAPAARRRLLDLRGRQVAPGAALGAERRRVRSIAGRSASASSATTASSDGDTNQWTPELVQRQRLRRRRRATPEEGYHLTEDLADRAIRLVHDQQQATPGKPFFLYFAPGRDARAAPGAGASGSSASAAATTTAGRRSATRAFARQQELGIVPRAARRCPRGRRGSRAGATLPARRAPPLRPHDGGVRGLPRAHRPPDRPRARLPARPRPARRHARPADLRQRGERRGRTARLAQRAPLHARPASTTRPTLLARADELGGHRAYNHYAWGWAWAGNTPFRLWKRFAWLGGVRTPLIAHWPKRHRRARRGARPVLPRDRPACRRCSTRSASTPPDGVDGVHAAADRRRVAARRPSTTRTRPLRATRSTSRCWAAARIYHDGWKATTDHVGAQLTVERERVAGQPRLRRATTGRCSDLDDDPAEARDVAAEHPDVLRRLVELWWAEAGTQPGAARSRTASSRPRGRDRAVAVGLRAARRARAGRRAGVARRCCRRWAAASAWSPTSRCADGGATACSSRSATGTTAGRSTSLDGRPVARDQPVRRPFCASPATRPLAPGRRAHRGPRTAVRAAAAGRSRCASTARRSREPAFPRDLPFRWQIGGTGAARRARPRLPGVRRLPAAGAVHGHDRARGARVALRAAARRASGDRGAAASDE